MPGWLQLYRVSSGPPAAPPLRGQSPYQLLLRDLQADPDVDGAGFTKIVVERYVESYKTEDGVWPITQCAIATDGIERISGALDDLSGSLRAELRENWPQLMTAQTNAVRFHFDLVDLATLCERLAGSSLSAETRSAAAAVQHALEPDGYVIAEGHLGDQVDGCQGVSVYLPAPNMPMSPYYKDLAFAKKHHWDELVGDYASAVRGGPSRLQAARGRSRCGSRSATSSLRARRWWWSATSTGCGPPVRQPPWMRPWAARSRSVPPQARSRATSAPRTSSRPSMPCSRPTQHSCWDSANRASSMPPGSRSWAPRWSTPREPSAPATSPW